MSLSALSRFSKTIGFRISLRYTGLLILAGVFLLTIIHLLLSFILADRDRNATRSELLRVAAIYSTHGIDGVRKAMGSQHGETAFFIRMTEPHGAEILSSDPDDFDSFDVRRLAGMRPGPDGWLRLEEKDQGAFDSLITTDKLEIASLMLTDGKRLQVGRSSEERNDLEAGALWIIGFASIPLLLVIAAALSHRALHPLRAMIATVESIQIGKMSSRVPTTGSGDELDELARLFNAMLERIEHLIEAMQESLDNVAHDLRTPITRLRTSVESALQANGPPEVYREALKDCMEETEEILSMLEILMDISEAQTGTMQLRPETVSVGQLIEDTVDLYRYVAEDRGVTIEGSCAEDLFVKADPRRIRQALANLVDNSVKYTESGGRISLQGCRNHQEATITVADTGVGISPDEMPRIWDRLYRGSGARTKKGIGLGLSLVHAIIESHGGAISAASEVDKGSVFTVRLPLASGVEKE